MTFSFKTGFRQSVLFVIAFAATFTVAALAWARDTESAGELLGRLLPFAFGLGLLISMAFQRGRRRLGFGLGAVLCAAAGQLGAALDWLERVSPRGVTLWSALQFPQVDALRAEPRFQRVVDESRPPGGR